MNAVLHTHDARKTASKLRRHMLTGLALTAAALTIIPLLAHAAGCLPMYFLMDVLAIPAIVLLLALGALAHRIKEGVFLHRLVTGAWVGLVATLAYDGIRWLLVLSGVFNYNPFISHPIFGCLITGCPEDSAMAIGVGWLYHFWNGISFGIMYTLLAGRARWHWAMGWAIFLEIAWLTTLPSVLQRTPNLQLITMSVIGHFAYGAGLGLLTQRVVRK